MPKFGVTVKDVSATVFIKALAEQLKASEKVKPPKWVDTVKTGAFKQLAPLDNDWFYTRAAAVARRIYIRGSVGVGAFKKIFGGSADRGCRPDHFARASGAVIRAVIHQLEAAEYLERVTKDDGSSTYKVSRAGQRALDRVASSILTGKQKA